MTEAWLLIDENAIRIASGNRFSSIKIELPAKKKLETLPDPKAELMQLIKQAGGFTGRRLHKIGTREAIHRVAGNIGDFSPLRNGVKITSQFDAILLPSSVPSFSLNSAAIRLKR